MIRHIAVPVVAIFAIGCGNNDAPSTQEPDPPTDVIALEAPAPEDGFQMAMEVTAEPGEEVWKCVVADLPEFPLGAVYPVGSVESVQNVGMHHMDIMAIELAGVDLEPGVHDCAAVYEEHTVLMESGVFLYASQQPEQRLDLPEGVAATVPSGMTYMQEVHYVNTSTEPIDVASYVNAYVIPADEVRDTLWGNVTRDTNLTIPPMSEHEEWTRCTMTDDADIIVMSSHTHELGRKVEVRRFDGANVGEEVYVNTEWDTPFLKQFEEPLEIKKGEGFEFKCSFDNRRNEMVQWGFDASDEMCQVAFVFTPGKPSIECKPVESSDGVL